MTNFYNNFSVRPITPLDGGEVPAPANTSLGIFNSTRVDDSFLNADFLGGKMPGLNFPPLALARGDTPAAAFYRESQKSKPRDGPLINQSTVGESEDGFPQGAYELEDDPVYDPYATLLPLPQPGQAWQVRVSPSEVITFLIFANSNLEAIGD